MAESATASRAITRREAAAICGVSPRTIDRAIKAGRFRAVRIGRRVLLNRAEFEALFGSQPKAGAGS
jgi:excisionase family DNA binding protein